MRSIFLSLFLALSACGGDSSTSSLTTSAADAYPAGVAVASPTSVVDSSSTAVASMDLPLRIRVGDWWEHLRQAVRLRDGVQLAHALNPLVPLGSAQAATTKVLEGLNTSNNIQAILNGTAVPTAATMPLTGFFKSYTPATCYGPQVLYAGHDQGGGNGTLPGGDVGMWLHRNGDPTTGTPCAAAQLSALMDPIKSRANASLMLGARMVALAVAGTGLPAASTSSNVTTIFQTFITSVMPTGTTANVTLADITNNGSDSFTYKWRVSFIAGSNVRWLVVNLTHQKTSTGFTGVLQYGTSALTNNTQSTANCATTQKMAVAGTLRYEKTSATETKFSAREAPYCVAGASNIETDFATWVSLDTNKELDPTKTTTTTATGWHQDGGGFKRFAATFHPTTGAGDYLFAWQAGVGDSNSRMFAVRSNFNSSSEARDLKAFFAFAPNMATTSNPGRMGEMICNWAGPSSNKTPGLNRFQSQALSLSSTATDWTFPSGIDTTDSKILFAPTNTCSSGTGMTFDVNANGTLVGSEGTSVIHGLDGLTSPNANVFAEITSTSRGFTLPSMY